MSEVVDVNGNNILVPYETQRWLPCGYSNLYYGRDGYREPNLRCDYQTRQCVRTAPLSTVVSCIFICKQRAFHDKAVKGGSCIASNGADLGGCPSSSYCYSEDARYAGKCLQYGTEGSNCTLQGSTQACAPLLSCDTSSSPPRCRKTRNLPQVALLRLLLAHNLLLSGRTVCR
jgi:hypothetical protein